MTGTAGRLILTLLSGLAAGGYWLGYLDGLLGAYGTPVLSVMGGALLAPPLFLLIQPAPSVLARLSAVVLAFVPVVALGLAVYLAADNLTTLARFSTWPLILCAFAAGLTLILLSVAEGRRVSPGPIFPLGAALLVVAMGLAETLGHSTAILLKTPLHLALGFLGAALLVGLVLVLLVRALPSRHERFLRAMIALLPLLGFTGTILGIMGALSALPDVFSDAGPGDALPGLLTGLGTAFETTLIGLVLAIGASFTLTLLSDFLADD